MLQNTIVPVIYYKNNTDNVHFLHVSGCQNDETQHPGILEMVQTGHDGIRWWTGDSQYIYVYIFQAINRKFISCSF